MNDKIKSAQALETIVRRLVKKRKAVVFTNGCFDIIHVGHVDYLKKAKELGDILVVGLNSDSSVRAIKGSQRPINTQRDRALVLASMACVDYVTVFNATTPERLIRRLRPTILVKGSDWRLKDIIGSPFVRSYGGRVARIPFVKGYSTSELLKKIARS